MALLFPAYPWKNRNLHTQSAVEYDDRTIRSSVRCTAKPVSPSRKEADWAHRDRDGRAAIDRG